MMTRIALVGCGGWGKNLARNLKQISSLAAIVDPNPGAKAIAEELAVDWFADLQPTLNDKSIRGIAIATPAATHASVAEAAMLAGKDVFVEKPIALKAADALRMIATATATNRILMVGHLLQYHPVFSKLAELVHGGALGQIRHISSSRLNLGVIRSEENVLWSFAPHDISMVLRLAGRQPDRVSAFGTTILQKNIQDITTVQLEFASGLRADIRSSWLHPQKEQKLIVVGDRGMLVFSDTRPWAEKLEWFHNEVSWIDNRPKAVLGSSEFVEVPPGEPLRLELEHFIHSIETRSPPRTDGQEALQVLNTLVAAQASLSTNGASIDLEQQDVASPTWKNVTVHATAEVDAGVEIGKGTKIWHFAHVLSGSRIGEGCTVGQNVMIGPDVMIGNNCKIQNNVAVYKGVTLEDDVFCGPSMVFTNVLTPRAHVNRKDEFAAIHVGKGATLGANCTIVCGNNIGEYAMVGAGAVVTKHVKPYALVVGNPARQIGWVSEAGESLGPDMICPRTGKNYSNLRQ
jgi:UDP-2-acetamido-3-amino-2,3-dideoxy-glucuronate N-acetyltransferase